MKQLVVSLVLISTVGCGDDEVCGPGEATADGVSMEIDGTALSYGSFTSSPNNDCPGDGPTSLTIEGRQLSPPPTAGTFALTFCLPNPDDIGSDPIELEGDSLVEVVDISGEADGCTFLIDRTRPRTGTIAFIGYCDDGSNPAGYAIELDGSVPVLQTCPAGPANAPNAVTLSGQASVDAINL